MKTPLPTRKLPPAPDLDQLKHQAKDLLKAYHAREPTAVSEVTAFYRDPEPATVALHDAQLVLARSYGYESWPKLKSVVDGVTVKRLIAAVKSNDHAAVIAMLKVRPELVNSVEEEFYEFTALHYAVISRMLDMARTLMRHGADARMGIYPNTDATSAMTMAAERGYDEMLAILREEEQRRESTPPAEDLTLAELRQILRSGDEDATIAVLERHPELTRFAMPGNRRTVLHLASALLMMRVSAWLIDHGADVKARTSDGATPLDVLGVLSDASARAESGQAMAALLLARGAERSPRAAVILGDLDGLRRSCASGELDAMGHEEGGLLRLAVDHDRPDILTLLLDLRPRSVTPA